MGKKFRIALAILVVAFLGAVFWQAQRPQEPVYHGKPLSYWLEVYDFGSYGFAHPNGPAPPTRYEANDAIRQIGTNAVPFLLQMLQQRDSKFKLTIIRLLQKQHFINIPLAPIDRNSKAYDGFVFLGSGASNAVPRLIEIFDRDHSAFCQQAVPAILGNIGPPAAQAVPTLLRGITHTNETVRANAIFALRKIEAEPKLVVPALIKCLNDPAALVRAQAACSLGAFGEDAQSAVPALIQLWHKEPPRPATPTQPSDGGFVILEMSLDGGFVSESWETAASYPFNAPDVVASVRDALLSIDPEAAARAGVK